MIQAKNKKKDSEKGFSLIELSVVLVILSILTLGVLKARDLIEQARLQKTISQITEHQLAVQSFIEIFGSLPGDFDAANAVLGVEAISGGGDGQISGDPFTVNSESAQFWRHLVLSQLIPVFGSSFAPETPLGGFFTVVQNPDESMIGTWLVLGNRIGNNANGPLLTPQQAMFINRKLDDGSPHSGRVRSLASPGCLVEDGTNYNLSNKNKSCALYIMLQ